MAEGYSGRVAYGKTITDAWKSLWKGFALWGVTGLGFLVFTLLITTTLGGAWALGLFDVNMDNPESMLAMFAALYGGMAISGLLGGFFYVGVHGGAAWVADELLAGRKPSVGDGLKYGFTRWPRTLGFELLFLGTMWLIYLLVFGVLFGFIVGLAAVTGDAGGVIAICGVCFMYVLMLVGIPLLASVVFSSEAVGLRTALLADAGAIGAYTQAWRTLRSGFKQLFLMGLLFMGLMWVYQMVTSIFTAPVYMVFMGDYYANLFQMVQSPNPAAVADPEAMLGPVYSSMGGMYTVMFALSAALMWPMMTFVYPLMGSFYRQLTGIEPPPEKVQPQAAYAQQYAQQPTPQQSQQGDPGAPAQPYQPTQPPAPPPASHLPSGPLPAPPSAPPGDEPADTGDISQD